MGRGNRRVVGELVYERLCMAVDVVTLLEVQREVLLSIERALTDELTIQERDDYARQLLRDGWVRVGEAVFAEMPVVASPEGAPE